MLALRIIATVLLGIMALLKLCASYDEEEVLIGILLAIPDIFVIVVIRVI